MHWRVVMPSIFLNFEVVFKKNETEIVVITLHPHKESWMRVFSFGVLVKSLFDKSLYFGVK